MKQVENLSNGLRQGMRSLASGVCIVSGLNADGERAAMTASSVTSVSDEPPSLLVCVNKTARMDHILQNSDYFCVNILSSSHQDVSEVCATPDAGEGRFDVGSWSQHEGTGLHYIDNAPAVFICHKQRLVPHGTHSIYIANVDEVLVSDKKHQHLVYANGRYHYL